MRRKSGIAILADLDFLRRMKLGRGYSSADPNVPAIHSDGLLAIASILSNCMKKTCVSPLLAEEMTPLCHANSPAFPW
jgi:hypothetical protein